MVTRRALAALVGWSLVIGAASANAQKRPARIGWIVPGPFSAGDLNLQAFREGMSDLGHTQGRDYELVQRSAEGVLDRVPAIADEIPGLNLDLVVCLGAALYGLRDRVTTLPLIYAFSGDPIEAGLADSLSRPRGNMTGLTFMSADLNEKRLELLREMVPGARRVVLTGNPLHPGAHTEVEASESMARRLGIEIRWRPIRNSAALEALLSEFESDRPDALLMLPDMLMLGFRERVAEFGLQHRVPTLSGWSAFAHSGGLLTYGPRLPESYRRLASYADRILKGSKPADIPIERPSVFELVINLRTARALGLEVSPSLVARADEIID